jgi:hypothetical protein
MAIVSLRNIHPLVVLVDADCVLCEVRTEFLYIRYSNFSLQYAQLSTAVI